MTAQQKTIGLIGGMSWQSTSDYYRIINEMVSAKLGGLHSAKIILNSVDFADIATLQSQEDWDAAAQILCNCAQSLERAGAGTVAICTNTMHMVADKVQEAIGVELVHIADATAKAIVDKNISTVALLGTKFTMEKDFYKKILMEKYFIETLIPNDKDREYINKTIFEELCLGSFTKNSKDRFLDIIKSLNKDGAQGVVLGCTEIPLLVTQENCDIPVINTTKAHCEALVDWLI